MEFAFGAQKYVAFHAPMICEIAGCVLNETNTDISEILSAPISQSNFTFVLSTFDR